MKRMLMKAAFAATLSLALAAPALAQSSSGTSLLPVKKGGTGKGTLTNHALLFGSGTSPITPYVCTGFLIGTGASADPTCTTTPAITDTTASTSTTTGALTVAGGVGIGGALNVGGSVNSYSGGDGAAASFGRSAAQSVNLNGTSAGNEIKSLSNPLAAKHLILNATTDNSDTAPTGGELGINLRIGGISALSIDANLDGTFAEDVVIFGDTASTSTSTGALTVAGGVGIAGALNVGGGFVGDLTGDVTGNADTATALETSRTIDGQSFDGTANITVIAPGTHAATSKTTPANADEIPLVDSAASNVLKKLTWANIKATLKTYFDAIYASLDSPALTGTPTAPTAAGGTNSTQIATTAFVQSAVGGAGGFAAASQAQMEAATSNVVGVTPGRMQYHPAMPKAIGSFTTATPPVVTTNFSALGTITATRNGVGDYTLSWTNSLTNPVGMFTGERTAGNGFASPSAAIGATSVSLRVVNGALTNEDINAVQFVIYGDL